MKYQRQGGQLGGFGGDVDSPSPGRARTEAAVGGLKGSRKSHPKEAWRVAGSDH